jgi:hypothetical protein
MSDKITITTGGPLAMPICDVFVGLGGFVNIKIKKEFFGRRAPKICLTADEAYELSVALQVKAQGL